MPHQCTNCERTFPDGSKEMLSGCPDCGGNKFQFEPSRRPTRTAPEGHSPASRGRSPQSGATGREAATGQETTADKPSGGRESPASADDWEWPDTAKQAGPRRAPTSPADGSTTESSASNGRDASEVSTGPTDDPEDSAQASARTDVVSPDELPVATGAPSGSSEPISPQSERRGEQPPSTGEPAGPDGPAPHHRQEPADEPRPSLEELRAELNEQFESIKVVAPGQYELNLMELYDREEYIISLQEDGRYVIEVPDSWRQPTPEE